MSRLNGPDLTVPPWAVVGLGRQDELLAQADVVVCGGVTGWWPRRCWPVCRWWWCPAAGTSGKWRIVLYAKAVGSWFGR
ncbi:putative glycosyltransferase domain protein [Mycobacterium xenopi 4042]|uniref:Putative glycosyltransferase domain protein n=1 Tax=Mycobacterium xenopi 4042 TaxID=1299334 RepID=X8CEN8_MYCXE|nr:putative glycosyltransferase domain protein [Mycobacterium xenopi 4042]